MKVPLMSGRRDTRTFWPREKEGIQKRRRKTLWRLDGEHVLCMCACLVSVLCTVFGIGVVTHAQSHTE